MLCTAFFRLVLPNIGGAVRGVAAWPFTHFPDTLLALQSDSGREKDKTESVASGMRGWMGVK